MFGGGRGGFPPTSWFPAWPVCRDFRLISVWNQQEVHAGLIIVSFLTGNNIVLNSVWPDCCKVFQSSWWDTFLKFCLKRHSGSKLDSRTPFNEVFFTQSFSQSVSCSSTLNQNSPQPCHIVNFGSLCVGIKLIPGPDGRPQGPSWSLTGTHLV